MIRVISPSLAFVLNHLWQSTLFAMMVSLLTLVLKRNRARTRYWLWLAASVKFLLPFSLLVSAGSQLGWRSTPSTVPPPQTVTIERIFVAPTLLVDQGTAATHRDRNLLPTLLFSTWLGGFLIVLLSWWRQWSRIRATARAATPLDLELPIEARGSPSHLEPGVFGIFHPVLLLPEGISTHLAPAQLKAVLAHELCHVRCHDNLAAALHMLVEAVFWFHPLVWRIGTRLVDERERACDEEVLRLGSEPSAYADGILKICELYLESPLPCVAGVTGSNLRRRIREIMMHRVARKLDSGRKLLLAIAGILAVAGPVVIGVLNSPRVLAQPPGTAAPRPAFEVASIKPGYEKNRPAARVNPLGVEFTRFTLRMLIVEAYSVKPISISSADSRTKEMLDRDTYDIQAKADHEVPKEQLRLMLQTLLADRFKLALHHDSKAEPVYDLVIGKSGPKMQESAGDGEPSFSPAPDGGAICRNMTMPMFSNYLSSRMGRVVLDRTELTGRYDFVLKLEGTPGLNQLRESIGSSADPGAAKRSMAAAMNDWSSSSIFSDIQKQLGLKLESDKAPVDNIVIDHVEKPVEN